MENSLKILVSIAKISYTYLFWIKVIEKKVLNP